MKEQTLELLRSLQTAERTEAGLAGVQALLAEARPGLRARGDRATLADASELLEVWAEAAPDPVAAGAVALAADIAAQDLEQLARAEQLHARALELAPAQLASLGALERMLLAAGRREEFEPLLAGHAERLAATEGHDPEQVAQLLQRLGALRDAASDLAGAISAYERALEHSADAVLVRELAEAYARRSAPGDGTQAADLFTMLAEVVEAKAEALPLVARALDLAPGHLGALVMLENATPQGAQSAELVRRWEGFVASSDDDEAVDARRPALARAYLDAGREKDALACIGPLVDRGDAAAAELQAECLAVLRAHEAPAADEAQATKGEHPREPTLVGFRLPCSSSVPPAPGEEEAPFASVGGRPASGVHKRPAQSGGTLVGFRLSEETLAALEAQDAAEASLKAQPGAREQAQAKHDAAATPAAASSASERPSANPALSPAEHAARLRRSAPALAPTTMGASTAPSAAATTRTGAMLEAPPAAPAPRPSTAAPAPRPSTAPAAPRSTTAAPRPSTAPAARPSRAHALSPAQLADTLRGRASTPPLAHGSSAELATASAAAHHAATLRRSSPASLPAPAPAPRAYAAAAAPAPSSLAAASAHAAVLRRSSPGASSAATAMALPDEQPVHIERPALTAVAREAGLEPLPHEPQAPSEPPQSHGDFAGEPAGNDVATGEAEHPPADDDAAHADAAAPDAPSVSSPPSPFAVAPSPVPALPTAAFASSSSKGSGRMPLAIGAAAVALVLGSAVFWLSSGKEEPSNASPSPSPSSVTTTAAPAQPGTTPSAAAPPSAVTPVGFAIPAAAAPVAPGLPTDPAAAAAATAPTAAGSTTTASPTEPAAAATPTQDEDSLGRVELAGAARIRGGKLRPKDVAAALREQLPAIERCYTETLEDKPSAAGGLTFGFTVNKAGKATAVKKLSGTLKDAALARCAVDALGKARFDKPKRPAKITVPLRFETR